MVNAVQRPLTFMVSRKVFLATWGDLDPQLPLVYWGAKIKILPVHNAEIMVYIRRDCIVLLLRHRAH